MKKSWNIFFGILGIIVSLDALSISLEPLIGVLFNTISWGFYLSFWEYIVQIPLALLIIGLPIIATIFSFKGKLWAKIIILILSIALVIQLVLLMHQISESGLIHP